MSAFVCVILNVITLVICHHVHKKFYYPVVILNLMWLFVNLLNIILVWNSNEFEYMILALPPLMFSIGFFIGEKTRVKIKNDDGYLNSFEPYQLNPIVAWLALGIIAIIFMFYAYFFISRIGLYSAFNRWYALRRIVWEEDINEAIIYRYGVIPAFLLPSVFLISAQRSRKKVEWLGFIIALFIAIVWSILRTSRTSTLNVVMLMVMSQILLINAKAKSYTDTKKAKRRTRRLFICGGIFILILFLYVALQKNENSYGEVSRSMFFLKSISNYTNLSSAAFVEWYKTGFISTKGENTFRFIIAVLSRLGIGNKQAIANSGGLYVSYAGLTTNAMTVARAYVEDYGVWFMAMMLMIFGMIHGTIYRITEKSSGIKKIRYALINAMLYIPLFYQILTNQYMNVLSAWLQYVIWIIVFTSPNAWKQTRYRNE